MVAKVATKAAVIVGAGTAQGAVEYGIDHARQKLNNDGEAESKSKSPLEEANKIISYIPGVNVGYVLVRKAVDPNLEEDAFRDQITQTAINTGGWVT